MISDTFLEAQNKQYSLLLANLSNASTDLEFATAFYHLDRFLQRIQHFIDNVEEQEFPSEYSSKMISQLKPFLKKLYQDRKPYDFRYRDIARKGTGEPYIHQYNFPDEATIAKFTANHLEDENSSGEDENY